MPNPPRRRAPAGAGSVFKTTIRRTRKDGTVSEVERWIGLLSRPDGKRKKVTGRTQREVTMRLQALQAAQTAGDPDRTDRQTVAAYLDWWLHNSLRCKATSWRAYEVLVRVHLVPALGRQRVQRLEPEHVERMLADLRRAGVSADRANRVRACLAQALGVLVRRRRVRYNAAALVEPYRVAHAEPEPLEPAECQRWLTLLQDTRVGAICQLAMTTGLRQGELLGLTWDDGCDLAHARVRVRQQVQVMADAAGTLRPTITTPKSRAGRRWVPIPSFVVDVLRNHRAGQELQRAAAGDRWTEQGLVFPNAKGGPQNANDLRREWYRARDGAGLPPVPFHHLRHVYRSLLTHLGVHPSVATRLMGHADMRMAAHYEHIFDSALTDAADRLDALLRTAPRDATRPDGAAETAEL